MTPGAPVINTIEYRDTGVILTVMPRVNSSGLVTLDITQEVIHRLDEKLPNVPLAAPPEAGADGRTPGAAPDQH